MDSSPPPSSSAVISGSDDLKESEVFWSADLDGKPRIMPSNSGVLVALSELDRKSRIGSIVTGESSTATITSSSSCSQPIPIPVPRRIEADCRKFQQSAPINVPKATRKQRNHEEEEEEEVLPPHERVANTTFSVLEGMGRTLKGRDLRRLRNAVWRTTGFLD